MIHFLEYTAIPPEPLIWIDTAERIGLLMSGCYVKTGGAIPREERRQRIAYWRKEWLGRRITMPDGKPQVHHLGMLDGGHAELREIFARFRPYRVESFRDGAYSPWFRAAPELWAFIAENCRPWDGEDAGLLGLPRPKPRQDRPAPVTHGLGNRLRTKANRRHMQGR